MRLAHCAASCCMQAAELSSPAVLVPESGRGALRAGPEVPEAMKGSGVAGGCSGCCDCNGNGWGWLACRGEGAGGGAVAEERLRLGTRISDGTRGCCSSGFSGRIRLPASCGGAIGGRLCW